MQIHLGYDSLHTLFVSLMVNLIPYTKDHDFCFAGSVSLFLLSSLTSLKASCHVVSGPVKTPMRQVPERGLQPVPRMKMGP